MEMDAEKARELVDEEENQRDERRKRFNTTIAVTIAILATFMALCRVKDNNIIQAIQAVISEKIEYFSDDQAHLTRSEVAAAWADQFEIESEYGPAEKRAAYNKLADEFRSRAENELAERKNVSDRIERSQEKVNNYLIQHEKFDLADASLSIAIAILAITALTQIRWLYILAMLPMAFGIIMGLAGFLNWNIEPEKLARFLGA
jgi:hypothetical protein